MGGNLDMRDNLIRGLREEHTQTYTGNEVIFRRQRVWLVQDSV